MATIDLNQNSADCIQATMNFGSTVYQNICSGAVSTVMWGTLDWFGFWAFLTLFVIFAAVLTPAIFIAVRAAFDL
jgi:hypothetical protein